MQKSQITLSSELEWRKKLGLDLLSTLHLKIKRSWDFATHTCVNLDEKLS